MGSAGRGWHRATVVERHGATDLGQYRARGPISCRRDANLQGAALRLFLRAVESCLRAHGPGSGSAARLGAVAFIHRFGSSLNPHLHFSSGITPLRGMSLR